MFRIGALLMVLIIVAASTWLTERRLANWERPVWVTFYPLAADEGGDTWISSRMSMKTHTPISIASLNPRRIDLVSI
jgi:hypothetical protein